MEEICKSGCYGLLVYISLKVESLVTGMHNISLNLLQRLPVTMVLLDVPGLSLASTGAFLSIATISTLVLRIFYNLYLHPLSKYHGPWYAASFSLCSAVISVVGLEPHWMLYLAKQYGCELLSVLFFYLKLPQASLASVPFF